MLIVVNKFCYNVKSKFKAYISVVLQLEKVDFQDQSPYRYLHHPQLFSSLYLQLDQSEVSQMNNHLLTQNYHFSVTQYLLKQNRLILLCCALFTTLLSLICENILKGKNSNINSKLSRLHFKSVASRDPSKIRFQQPGDYISLTGSAYTICQHASNTQQHT